jgi:broad specificity phosphatase PhoE
MLEIVLVRPGACDYSDQHRIQGTLDVPLNEHGVDEVDSLIRELRGLNLQMVYTSDCEPTLQTANAIGKALDVRVKKLKHMENLNHGLWQGMLIEELKRCQPTVYRQWQERPQSICPPDGETLAEAQARVEEGMAKLLRKHKEGRLAIVAPEPLATLICSKIRGAEIGDLWQAPERHGRWEILSVVNGTPATSR